MTPVFPDHFSGHADLYARYRPRYPAELFAWIAAQAPARGRCWDVATGSGQAALALVDHFAEVIATDASPQQLAHAVSPTARLHFRQALAEDSGLPSASVDVVTVAAAAHWFDLPRFYTEVERVARPGALVVLWTYSASLRIAGAAPPALLQRLSGEVLGPYWPPQFARVRDQYRSLPFPFAALDTPPPTFQAREVWTLAELQGHIRTWSAYPRARAATGEEPLAPVADAMEAWWASLGGGRQVVTWDLSMRAGYVRA